jgi:hypothetical protein
MQAQRQQKSATLYVLIYPLFKIPETCYCESSSAMGCEIVAHNLDMLYNRSLSFMSFYIYSSIEHLFCVIVPILQN